jgi:large subunit ribosomal protein L7/L12
MSPSTSTLSLATATATTSRSFSSLSRPFALSLSQSHSVSHNDRDARFLHSSSILLEEEKELSPKEKKKLLKAKAKQMTQEKVAGGDAADAEAAAAAEAGDDTDEEAPVEDAAAATEAEAVVEAPSTPAPAAPAPDAAAAALAAAADAPATEYSTPELTRDAAAHKQGLLQAAADTEQNVLADQDILPSFQNPLHHHNPDMEKIFRSDFDSDEAFEAASQPAPPFVGVDGAADAVITASELAPEYLNEIADEIVHLTMLEMNELINKIADHYDFDEGMLSPDDDGSGGGGGDDDDDAPAAEAVVEKTIFDIKLVAFDPTSKIKVIKEVRAIAGLGLKEAKEMVEGAPKTILKDIKKEQAEEIKAKLEELGATVEIV